MLRMRTARRSLTSLWRQELTSDKMAGRGSGYRLVVNFASRWSTGESGHKTSVCVCGVCVCVCVCECMCLRVVPVGFSHLRELNGVINLFDPLSGVRV